MIEPAITVILVAFALAMLVAVLRAPREQRAGYALSAFAIAAALAMFLVWRLWG